MARSGTKVNNNSLTAKQRKMAEALTNPDFDGTVTELCESLNVPRRTYYHWLEKPEFREYMTSLVGKYADSELATVWKALIEQCTKGNVKAMKLYFERTDMMKGKDGGTSALDRLVEALKNV